VKCDGLRVCLPAFSPQNNNSDIVIALTLPLWERPLPDQAAHGEVRGFPLGRKPAPVFGECIKLSGRLKRSAYYDDRLRAINM
jgi:hypothetical protein